MFLTNNMVPKQPKSSFWWFGLFLAICDLLYPCDGSFVAVCDLVGHCVRIMHLKTGQKPFVGVLGCFMLFLGGLDCVVPSPAH
jgi:hypothetical protein